MAITYYDDTYYGDTYHGRSLRDLLLDPSRDVRMDAVRHRTLPLPLPLPPPLPLTLTLARCVAVLQGTPRAFSFLSIPPW